MKVCCHEFLKANNIDTRMSLLRFTKMHGLGNDFIVINNMQADVFLEPERIRRLADRHTGIGFDQLLLVEPAQHPDAEFDYRIFNADGAEVEHCGNGARCFARYVVDQGLSSHTTICVNTNNGLITLKLNAVGDVTVLMGVPEFEPSQVPFLAPQVEPFYELQVADTNLQVGVAAISNPHVLLAVEDVDTAAVQRLGQLIERHPRFPNRVNVGFMQRIDSRHIRLRVFERGVGETRACGTGACAAVAIGHIQGKLDKTVTVSLPGGDLQINWPNINATIEMTGSCSTVFEGQTKM